MAKPSRICSGIWAIGGSGLSDPYDCAVYLVAGDALVLVDSGAGRSFEKLVRNIEAVGFDPRKVAAVLVTHAHIDHIGALRRFRDACGARIIAHELDAGKIERGTGIGAEAYGVPYDPCPVDERIAGEHHTLAVGGITMGIVHIPGHTPGSIAAYMDVPEGRVLFGQDIHGPYLAEWGADRKKARDSLAKLIALKADILCEGHFGVYRPAAAVERYIRGYLDALTD